MPPSTRIAVNLFSTWRLHVAWVCTRAARKENPNPDPNSHDHCLLSKWKCPYGVYLAGLLGGRMASAEGRSVPSRVEYGEGCSLPSRPEGLGERRELLQRGPGRKRILAYFEGSFFVPV